MGEGSSHLVLDAEEDDHADIPGTWGKEWFECAGARLTARGACGERQGRQGREGGVCFHGPHRIDEGH